MSNKVLFIGRITRKMDVVTRQRRKTPEGLWTLNGKESGDVAYIGEGMNGRHSPQLDLLAGNPAKKLRPAKDAGEEGSLFLPPGFPPIGNRTSPQKFMNLS